MLNQSSEEVLGQKLGYIQLMISSCGDEQIRGEVAPYALVNVYLFNIV
jgi:hypothetical protein